RTTISSSRSAIKARAYLPRSARQSSTSSRAALGSRQHPVSDSGLRSAARSLKRIMAASGSTMRPTAVRVLQSRSRSVRRPKSRSEDAMNDVAPVAILVEDERQIRRFVRTALETEEWRVFEAETLKQGLVEAGTRKPDVVILDLGLPDGDGVDFIRDLRAWSSTPVIVLSARVDETQKIAALDAGADDYLTKPFGVGELLARVRAVLRRKPGGTTADLEAFHF